MKTKPHYTGNIILAFDRNPIDQRARLFLGLKPPETEEEKQRIRRKIGCGKWVPLGGGFEPGDRSQKAAAKRELFEESGEAWKIPLADFKRVGIIDGYLTRGRGLSWDKAEFSWRGHIYQVIIPEHLHDTYRIQPEQGKKPDYIRLAWRSAKRPPLRQMISSDKLWLPRLIKGEQLHIEVMYVHQVGGVIADYRITPIRLR